MKKIFPYLSPPTACRLRSTSAQRIVKIQAVVESAIDAFSEALAIEADELQDAGRRRRTQTALDGARDRVRNRTKVGLVKVGTAISPDKFTVLRQIQGSGRFLSDTIELVLSYYMWHAPKRRKARDDFSGFLWPPIDLPAEINIYDFLSDVSESK